MASSVDSELDFPDLSSMLEQSLTTEMCAYEGDSSNDRPAYVDSSIEGSVCNTLNAPKHVSSAVKEIRAQNNSNADLTVNEEHEFYQDYVKTNKLAKLKSFKCTVCSSKIGKSEACTHPVLDVLVCKHCRVVYGDGQFEQSDGMDDYCRWCAEGGDQICCDHCSSVFCTECLRRNLGSAAFKEIKHSGQWTCLACNPKPIWNLRAECRWLITDSQDYNGEENSKVDGDVPAENISEILKVAKSIGTRYLQDIERITEKSESSEAKDKLLLIDLDAAAEETLAALRNFKETLSAKIKSFPEGVADDSEEPRLILKVKNFREINERDGFYAEIRHSPHTTPGRNPRNKKLVTETQPASEIQSKEDRVAGSVSQTSPVKDHSEDSMGEFFDMAKAAMERSENSPQSPVLPETDDAPAAKETAAETDEPLVDAKEKARNELLATSDSDVADSVSTPRTKKTKRRNDLDRTSKNSTKNPDKIAKTAKEAKVKKQTEDSDSEAALEKKIKRLEDLNVSKSKQSISEEGSIASSRPRRNAKPKTKASALLSSDESGEESDTEEETKTVSLDRNSPKEDEPLDEKEKARQELLAVSSESSSEEQAEGEVKSESKSKKPVKKEKVVKDSDDDFVETKEKKIDSETEDLLKAPLNQGGKRGNDEAGEKEKKKKDAEEKKKRAKRRIKSDSESAESAAGSDSDFESDSKGKKSDSGESSDGNQPKRKKRRRIKAASSSGSGSDSDVQILNDSQKSGGKGRKNIKKIIKDKHLHSQTKEAVREEEERIRRIQDRQNFYNESFKDDYMVNARIEKLVLDFDPDTKKELVSVDKRLVEKLKPHQAKGVKFMWDACFESVERIKEHPGSGCILAHCMGLGKTLQVVTLVHTVLSHPECNVKNVLVVCPLSTVLNWVNEFKTWLVDEMEPDVYELANVKQNDMRMYHVRMWSQNGGILVMGYEMYRNITNEKNKRVKAKYREIFQRALVEPGPDLVVCDEGHLLKNEASALSKAINRIATRRRIILTGTPLQNSLSEYHCMIQFVKPNLLGTKKEFTNRFGNPIKNGQCADSTEHDVRIMKRRAHVLHKKLEGCVQRFDYSVLTPFLPPKHEYVISVKMSELQVNMYRHYLEKCARGGPNASMPAGRGKGSGLFADFQELGKIWTHPRALQLAQIRREQRATGDSEDSMNDFIDDGSGSEGEDEVVCLDNTDDESNEEAEEENTGIAWKSRTRAGRGNQPAPEEDLSTVVTSNCWWSQFVTEDDMAKIEHSGKLFLLMEILRKCELIGDKVLVFSQSLVSLDLIEEFLHLEEERRHEAGFIQDGEDTALGTWRLNVDYFRFDGSTSAELRKNWCNAFNSPKNSRARLFLISTRAGGLGINMVAANRVIIFDASWNPSHDVQSIFRVYRFGQKKPCYIYRFLAQGTMEEKIYDRQVTKLSLSCRVVDEQQIERHFNASDLAELYSFDLDSHTRRPTPMIPKDRLLGELMMHQKQWIVTFHEHDSLLQNKADEELNEEERKAAWEDYENENRGIFNNPMFENNPGAAGLLDAQLQMLAGRTVGGVPLSALVANIRSAYPNLAGPELLQRLQLVVEQIQNMNMPQYAAMMAASGLGVSQQPLDAQRLILQRQQALEQQQKNQFSGAAMQQLLQAASMGAGIAGPSGIMPPVTQSRRGRPPIGPHQRVDMFYPTVRPNILSSAPRVAPSAKNPPGNKP